jgi:hypothetical protein
MLKTGLPPRIPLDPAFFICTHICTQEIKKALRDALRAFQVVAKGVEPLAF